MGNQNSNDNISDHFKNTCHPGLSNCQYDPAQQLLWTVVKVQADMLHWRSDIDPLLPKSFLFMPYKITNHDFKNEVGCMPQEQFHRPDIQFKKIYYQPCIYSLEKEILIRRQKNTNFREQELWKMISQLCKACIEWQQTYPQQKLGVICPKNVVINPQGMLKLVCKISFFGEVYGNMNQYYVPPESSANEVIKFALNPHSDPVAVEASTVYSVGAVVLEAATLTLIQFGAWTLQQKLQMFRNSPFSESIKQTIWSMMAVSQSDRLKLRQILRIAKANKFKHL